MSQKKSFLLNIGIKWMKKQEGFAGLIFSVSSGEYQHIFVNAVAHQDL